MHGSSMPSVVPLVLLESKHTWVQSDPCGSTVVRVPVMLWLYRLGPWSGGLCRVGLHSASPTIPTIPEGLSAQLRWPKSARCSLDRRLPGAAAGVWPSPGKSYPAVNGPIRWCSAWLLDRGPTQVRHMDCVRTSGFKDRFQALQQKLNYIDGSVLLLKVLPQFQ